MNSDHIQSTKDMRDMRYIQLNGKFKNISPLERKLGNGLMFAPIMYFFCVSNALIYASRSNMLNSRSYFLVTVFGAFPASYILSRYLFGHSNLIQMANNDDEL